MVITTDIYNITTTVFIRESIKRFLSHNWWWIAIPVVASIIIGVAIDTRFLFISAMIVFLIIPTILMMVYFSRALSIDARKHIIPKYITIDESSVKTYFINPDPDNMKYILPDNETMPLTDIVDLSVDKQNMVLRFVGDDNRFIIIPLNAFNNNADIACAIDIVYSVNRKQQTL